MAGAAGNGNAAAAPDASQPTLCTVPRLLIFVLLTALMATPAAAQHAADSTMADTTMAGAYRVFRADGQAATLDDLVAAMAEADVVFVGEEHDDPVGHYLEAELLQRAYARYGHGAAARPVALSLEMFERDVQPVLDEYLAGLITEEHFLKSSRPWNNYESDYRSLVEFARAHRLSVVAANAPRRYVNRVSRLGPASLDTLSAWARTWLPPLPYPGPSPAYEARWNEMMAEMMAEYRQQAASADSMHAASADSMHASADSAHADAPQESPDEAASEAGVSEEETASSGMHGGAHLLDAQAFWDAAMADALSRYLKQTPGALVLHMVGSFHVEGGLGIPAQLEGYRPGTRRLVVVVQAEENFQTFDAEGMGELGDFVILTDESLPRTFENAYQ